MNEKNKFDAIAGFLGAFKTVPGTNDYETTDEDGTTYVVSEDDLLAIAALLTVVADNEPDTQGGV